MAVKYVYLFGVKKSEGDASMRNLLGGKGANLAEMSGLGLPVPAGFTISTEVCTYFYKHDSSYPQPLRKEVEQALAVVESAMGARFGDPKNPLLLSVRSGSRVSMPGMMETVLNLGLNNEIVEGLISKSSDRRFCYDVYRRFVQMFGDVVMGLRPAGKEIDPFEELIERKKRKAGVELDTDLTAEHLHELVSRIQSAHSQTSAPPFSRRPPRAAVGSHRCRVRFLAGTARNKIPGNRRHSQ